MPKQTNSNSHYRLCGLLAESPSMLSESMHNAGFRALGLDYYYLGFSVEDIKASILAMRSMKFRGYSVTIPFKEVVIPLIDELDADAKQIQAVNTLINRNGLIHGYNTDWIGIQKAILEKGIKSIDNALIIGAGGASRAAIFALQSFNCKKIDLTNRTKQTAEELQQRFQLSKVIPFTQLAPSIEKYDMIINSTPLTNFSEIESFHFGQGQCIFDMITKVTPLLEIAARNGADTIPGVRMLLHQAFEQFTLFTEKPAPKEIMEEALYQQLKTSTQGALKSP